MIGTFAIIPYVDFESQYYFKFEKNIHLPTQSGLSGKRSSNANAWEEPSGNQHRHTPPQGLSS